MRPGSGHRSGLDAFLEGFPIILPSARLSSPSLNTWPVRALLNVTTYVLRPRIREGKTCLMTPDPRAVLTRSRIWNVGFSDHLRTVLMLRPMLSMPGGQPRPAGRQARRSPQVTGRELQTYARRDCNLPFSERHQNTPERMTSEKTGSSSSSFLLSSLSIRNTPTGMDRAGAHYMAVRRRS